MTKPSNQSGSLRDRIALVTGASRGVGRGIARGLGEEGATVYVTGRSWSDAERTEALPGTVQETAQFVSELGGVGIAVRCDHAADKDVAELFEQVKSEYGRIDILVNNVWGGYYRYDGATFDAPFWEQPMSRWDLMFGAGVRAHFSASRLAAAMMIAKGQGLIVNVSFGHEKRYLGSVPYDVSKNAVDRLTAAMALELRQHNVAALALYPGFVRTERVLQGYTGDLSVTHSPLYAGRAVAALACDPDVLSKSGGAFACGDLAREYGFTDEDGRQPPATRLDTPVLP